MAGVAVWVGAKLTWLDPLYFPVVVASLATFFVCAGGNVVNDLRDIEIDRINRPDRVLVTGALSIGLAQKLSILCNILGLVLALLVNWQVAVIAGIAISLLYLYNYKAKRMILVGNLIIAFLSGMVFITGGLAVAPELTWQLPGPLIAAIFAFLFHLVREIVKDVEDAEGDSRLGIITFPQIIGYQNALGIGMGLFFIMVLFTYLPILKNWFSDYYKVITVYMVDLPLLGLLIFAWGFPGPSMLRWTSIFLKIGMGLGIIALILA